MWNGIGIGSIRPADPINILQKGGGIHRGCNFQSFAAGLSLYSGLFERKKYSTIDIVGSDVTRSFQRWQILQLALNP